MAKIANDEKKIEAKSPKKRPATVYAATVIFGGAKLELRMSYPISGDLRVNIYTIPHRVEAIENASPTEEALRQFAAQLLASQ